jgi:TonB-dependent receptor
MDRFTTPSPRRKRLSTAVSLAVSTLLAIPPALAQQAPAGGEISRVVVSGARASQQSSIDRKKNAATAIDSIVAEDVGSLPDRNIGEAISRMAGIALDRGEYGEGVSVAVRGNSSDLTRVELDGQGVQSAGGADMGANSGASGRAVEFRQLSADLIKSVDIVKGSTADQTEGSLGGGIIIKTRTGLDFKKPYASVRIGASQGSLNKQWKPDTNVVLANKFLDGRLGLVLNASSTTVANESHSVQTAFSALQGYYRTADFDQSPEKTFSFLPSTLNMADASVNSPLLQSPLIGGGMFNAATPFDMLTRAVAAQSKDDCRSAFPALSQSQLNAMESSARGPAQAQRGNELITCLNQWNDYTPSGPRYFVRRELDRRQNLDLRADFKVNNDLTVFAKGSYNRRKVDSHQLTYALGNISTNPGATISPSFVGRPYVDDNVNGVRNVVPNSGYWLYDMPTPRGNAYPYPGMVINIDPASVVTDANHHLTKYTISDGAASTDQLRDHGIVNAKYLQLGGTYKKGGLNADFFLANASSDFRRAQKRISFTTFYGPATMQVLPNGLWGYSFPESSRFNQGDPAQYGGLYPATGNSGAVALGPLNNVAVPAYTIAQQPLLTPSSPRTEAFWNPQIRETFENTAKLDLSYAMPESVPFLSRIKTGFNLRKNGLDNWNPGDGNSGGIIRQAAVGTYGQPGYQAPIVIPTPIARTIIQGCQDTAGSLGPGGKRCAYGYTISPDPRLANNGTLLLDPQQWQDLVALGLSGQATSTRFFDGAKGRPDGMLDNWTQLDVEKLFNAIGAKNNTYDCVKTCVGSDGQVYDQPKQELRERTDAFYLMGDFSIERLPFTAMALPFGLTIDGNVGVRYVRTRVSGSGMMTLISIAKTAAFDPLNPNAEGGTVTNTFVRNTAVDAKADDILPSLNLAAWLVPDQLVLRYSAARTVARPPAANLLPSGTCTYDERTADGDQPGTQRCSGTLGNPELQAQQNFNQNLSVEYYPNRDTMLTAAVFNQKGKVGPGISQGVNSIPLFAGSALVDPATGVNLGSLPFDYSMWVNGAATTRKGLELGGKTAFTFLPGVLRNLGMDANATRLRSVATTQNAVDLLTGAALPPQRESKYSYNWALWYDDGRLSARVAVQAVAMNFSCIAGCQQQGAIQNYPAVGVQLTKFPYNPGSPNFKDTTRFVDAKVSYRVLPNLEVFVEGRNLGNATTSNSQGSYAPFADGTPNILDYSYAGRRLMVGLNFRTE